MKTIEEINEIAPYHPCEWQQGYGIWQSGYMEGQKNGALEQKAIDDAELHQRFEKVLNGQKWDLIDKFKSKLKSILIIAQDPTMHQERKEMEILAMIQNSLEE